MTELKRTLTVWRGTGMFLNIVLGAGLLTLPGLAVQATGDAAILVWAACALAALPLLIIFASLGRRCPNSGGLAAILKQAFGDFGYVAATFLFLGAVIFGLPAIALTGGHYAASMFGGSPHVFAMALLLGAVLVNLISPERAALVNGALASILVFILLAVAAVGWAIVRPDVADLVVAPDAWPEGRVFWAAFMMVFFAFTGWEVGANLGGEFRNARRNLPLAMMISFGIAVMLYGVLAVIVQAANIGTSHEAPFAALFGQQFGAAGTIAIGTVSVLLIFANLSAAIWAVSRMVFSAAGEKLLPSALGTVRNDMPRNAVCATVGALLVVLGATWMGLLELGSLLAIAGQNFLLLYAAAAMALMRLAHRTRERLLATVGILLVGGLVVARGLDGMFYPSGLLFIAALITHGRRIRMPFTSGA